MDNEETASLIPQHRVNIQSKLVGIILKAHGNVASKLLNPLPMAVIPLAMSGKPAVKS